MEKKKKSLEEKLETFLKIIGISVTGFIVLIILMLLYWSRSIERKMERTRPNTDDMIQYVEESYNKKIKVISEEVYTAHYGDDGSITVENCPIIQVEDIDTGITFYVSASFYAESWSINDDFGQQSLIYCLKEQEIQYKIDESYPYPRLLLKNSIEEAEKLQKAVILFNEIYTVDVNRSLKYCVSFQVPGVLYAFPIYGGYISDERKDENTGFYFDTPIEKYERFLNDVIQKEE